MENVENCMEHEKTTVYFLFVYLPFYHGGMYVYISLQSFASLN